MLPLLIIKCIGRQGLVWLSFLPYSTCIHIPYPFSDQPFCLPKCVSLFTILVCNWPFSWSIVLLQTPQIGWQERKCYAAIFRKPMKVSWGKVNLFLPSFTLGQCKIWFCYCYAPRLFLHGFTTPIYIFINWRYQNTETWHLAQCW